MMIRILPIVGLLLLIPLIAMQLTNEVNWSFFDFIIMGVLLTITGLLIGIIFQKVKNSKNRQILIITIEEKLWIQETKHCWFYFMCY